MVPFGEIICVRSVCLRLESGVLFFHRVCVCVCAAWLMIEIIYHAIAGPRAIADFPLRDVLVQRGNGRESSEVHYSSSLSAVH